MHEHVTLLRPDSRDRAREWWTAHQPLDPPLRRSASGDK